MRPLRALPLPALPRSSTRRSTSSVTSRPPIGPVILRARLLPDNVLDIMVKDRGCGIADLEQACRPMFTTGGEERSGMGITIMESFMTEFRISSVPGKGTTVHMKRRIVRRGGKK